MENATLQTLLNTHSGLVTYPHLRRLGYTRDRIEHEVTAGRWQRVLYGVYAVTTGPLNRQMVLDSALLYGGGGAVLSHGTAATLWGIQRIDETDPVHITLRYGRSAVSQAPSRISRTDQPAPFIGELRHPGVVVHRSRALTHIAVEREFPCTSRADTVLDMAVLEPTPKAAYATLIACATNGGVRPDLLLQRMQDRKPRRYIKAIASAIDLLRDGVQSMLEFHYAIDVEKAHGLPRAMRQSPVVVDGRTLYEDVEYPMTSSQLIVRLDGRLAHSFRDIVFRDRRRENAAEIAGKHSLVFGWEEVHDQPCAVAAEVRLVLVRGGVDLGPNPCPNCE
ncbi:hypothetical protein [Antrihabitans cavernicola]|uniref:Type IV toxin-antitoxin system AbiEi family antitoxin domain-containing protein n=1 Tax=Antrihabitans cavernicola TaxID=2495913 RepID=A0A5A7S6S8_9NOCA|nr:hypothetical protein [Spelaeibacter cavernicola]KAA0021858.1 hypothetical protein FOY51_15795 [Spelaeibacter cavernicola]